MSDMSDMSTTCQDMGCRLLRGGGVTCPGIYCTLFSEIPLAVFPTDHMAEFASRKRPHAWLG